MMRWPLVVRLNTNVAAVERLLGREGDAGAYAAVRVALRNALLALSLLYLLLFGFNHVMWTRLKAPSASIALIECIVYPCTTVEMVNCFQFVCLALYIRGRLRDMHSQLKRALTTLSEKARPVWGIAPLHPALERAEALPAVRRLCDCYELLAELCELANALFGLTTLLDLAVSLVYVVAALYLVLSLVLLERALPGGQRGLHAALNALWAALPAAKVVAALRQLLRLARRRRPRFSAAGLVDVEPRALAPIAATAATYVIVLLQFHGPQHASPPP
ncbi:Protein of unknown function [Gryllus bimaculatus]|nr:Protein of unknown function [Gryllus bimaculatus]